MARTMKRAAAFAALFKGLTSGPGLGRRLGAFPALVKESLRGRYDGRWRLALMLGALAYIVSPIDILPELFLGLFGLADDVVVAGWLAGAFLAETERFLNWRGRQSSASGPVIDGDITG